MRRWTRVLPILALGAVTFGVAARADAGTAPVLQFAASPSPAYGSVAVGQSLDQTFTLINTGGTASAAIKVTLSPALVYTIAAGGDHCTAISLGPKKTCTVTVTYTPAAAGANDSATLTASAKKPAHPASLTLTGTSPTGLSTGCLYLQQHPTAGEVIDNFAAGEVISLTNPTVGGLTKLYINLVLESTTAGPTPATYTVPSDGSYRLDLFFLGIDGWVWGCTPAG